MAAAQESMVEVGVTGYSPLVSIERTPRELYRELWTHPEYRLVSPAEACVNQFLEVARPERGASFIDLGCGVGRASLALSRIASLCVTMVDFAAGCLDDEVRAALGPQFCFSEHDLTRPLPVAAKYGLCVDVLEHLSESALSATLDNCLHACRYLFLQVSTIPDACGALVGATLHETVRPYTWWLERLRERDAAVLWSHDLGSAAQFYVSAWVDAQEVVDVGVLNVSQEQVLANVQHNIVQGWQQVEPHATNTDEVMLVGGGPSLAGFAREIRRRRKAGAKLVTLNGAYNWALEQGLTPSAQIIVDARPFNARFTKPVVDDCKYLICSQCHPSVLEGLPKDRTFLWHTSEEAIREALDEQYEVWWGVPGGSTVLLRAIPLLRMLGFKKFRLYGCDSCLNGAAHHAFEQPENASEFVIPVSVGERIFQCHPWMASQAQEFVDLIKVFGDAIELTVHGDGLLAHILTTGARSVERRT